MNKNRQQICTSKNRRYRGSVLIEALCGFFIFIPLAFLIADIAVITTAAQANEEFAEQLARLCSTLQTKDNADKACSDVIRQYRPASNVTQINLDQLEFDVALKRVTLSTSMTIKLPIPIPGHATHLVKANVTQPIVSFPAEL